MKSRTSSSPADGGVTVDLLLDGRVRLIQSAGGLRAAIDPVLLAAAIATQPGDRVLEVGCGTGAAALCLAARMRDLHIVGLDLQPELIALARQSAVLNGMPNVTFYAGDLLTAPDEVVAVAYDHVMANPPFARAGSGRVSPDPSKALASMEGAADLPAWVAFCAARVRPGGSVTFIHRADRAAEVAALFVASGLDAAIQPIGGKRVLVHGTRGGTGVRHLPVIDLHLPDGGFTPVANAILRDAQALSFGH